MLKKYEMQYPTKQKLDDMTILEKLVNGELDMNRIDDDVKIRLITICNEQLENVEQRIKESQRSGLAVERYNLHEKLVQGNYKILF